MDEQVIFTTAVSGTVCQVHSVGQANLRQCAASTPNSAVLMGDKLLVAQANKALINVYSVDSRSKKEALEQRLPLPEQLSCLAVVENHTGDAGVHQQLPYLLLGSTPSGKLYVWEAGSGKLLTVKAMAHYQAITKMQAIINGKYVVTAGADSRLIIWQTASLVLEEEPKPLYVLHDHTLAITDFAVSNAHNGKYLNSKLYTVSEDMTVRCYQLSSQLEQPQLLATFTFPLALTSIALDPADRCLYVGTREGAFALPLFYKLDSSGATLVNLLQPGKHQIYSIVPEQAGVEVNKQELYRMGQLLCSKMLSCHVSLIRVSMDGSMVLLATGSGNCVVVDTYSKQPVKELAPLLAPGTQTGPVSNIITRSMTVKSDSLLQDLNLADARATEAIKIPALAKTVFDKTGTHDIIYCAPTDTLSSVLPRALDLPQYLDMIAEEDSVFANTPVTRSTVKVVGELAPAKAEALPASSAEAQQSADDTDAEVARLRESLQQLTGAYKDLRALHEKLYEEHEKLLQTSK
ncbi:ABL141Cp [Eremothecium gossypii ATCC 10895]|uniref:Pre-rRNA-processing protein IPI3 n=1 Tax=Eremothecium gossypii (strain ATCC 10895 / CBS 109.51 / FGSC 9923 / NRRL Y-1056) TaxID=284811 RepID=IPI3_EREGS|nr:ABL141Cp [Eremothecium gossypii ATCC 10895]Q75E14.1 RecName: Full=Pre-rRNA-processing protein IPI3 [Eremothecium gossypii ATCC 10895]AAS50630.1 ABL141Cp [Eremothecium gossypii ATCC 10895]AEY94918.1 FABL141Cp [Eremothecium gossypii FDAG1]